MVVAPWCLIVLATSKQRKRMLVDSDEDLLRRFQRGDLAALTDLVRRWEAAVYRVAYRVTRRHEAAEDVRQTVFLKLVQKPDSVRNVICLRAWLRRAAINEAINVVRRKNRRRFLFQKRVSAPKVADETSSEDEVMQREERELLELCLARMQPAERAILALRFDEGLTYQEMAEVLEMPASTLKTQVKRAVAELKQKFEAAQGDNRNGTDTARRSTSG